MAHADDRAADVEIKTRDWAHDHPAVHHEQVRADGHGASWRMLRHPAYPFVASVRDDGSPLQPLLHEVAQRYLERVPGVPAVARPDDRSGEAGHDEAMLQFGWLQLAWGDRTQSDGTEARGSYWVVRQQDGVRQDRTAVLVAANRIFSGGRFVCAGGEVGLRVVLHVGLPEQGRSRVRVTGLSTSLLEHALSAAAAADLTRRIARTRRAGAAQSQHGEDSPRDLVDFLQGASRAAALAFGFERPPALNGLAVGGHPSDGFLLSGVGMRGSADAPRICAWTASLDSERSLRASRRSLVEQVTHLNQPEDVMQADPASRPPAERLKTRRPTRPAVRLDAFRQPTRLLPPPTAGNVVLGDAWVQVQPPRAGSEPDPPPPPVHEVPDDSHPLRSDDLAAVHAFVRGKQLFQRLKAYGLDAQQYFRMARLPLLLQHRAAFRSASDGEVVNAQVSPTSQGLSLYEPFHAPGRPQLLVGFGWANLSHRECLPNNAKRRRAQPLGLAADPRWAWHEFGHVLNFASTGELEFRFAHSAGDALAAIVADPDSQLADPGFQPQDPGAQPGDVQRLRFLTFPWAMLGRSHGRPVLRSWCWCGRRSRLRLARHIGPPPIPGGYFEEQLMSSSLFRLYRAIGGDTLGRTPGDRARRHGASDYAVYLIMRAIALLGPAAVVPARSADQFVSALIDADIGTAGWTVTADWPEPGPQRIVRRHGGAVHKVIRWAFEQQGLYAAADPSEVREGPGRPPAVDIYVPGSGARAGGGYDPVALAWSSSEAMPWHAPADSILANGGGLLRVRVQNRGSQPAHDVSARAWVSPAGGARNWHELKSAAADVSQKIGPSGARYFGFEARDAQRKPLLGRYLVLVAATCPADRANIDPQAELPCGQPSAWMDPDLPPDLLTDLVANDNNLGLRIVDFQ
jgi:hypothetical protein